MWSQKNTFLFASLACTLCCAVARAGVRASSPNSCSSDRLHRDLTELRYDKMAVDLAGLPASVEHDLFQGILDNRMNRMPDSVRVLTPLVSAHQLTPSHMALVLATLADDHVKLFEYAKASHYYDRLLSQDSYQLSADARLSDTNDNSVLKLLKKTPKQTISLHGVVDLPASRDPHGVYRIALAVHGVTRDWIIDTGADHSVVSESFAKQLRLKLSSSAAATQGFGGIASDLHVAIVSRFNIGGATVLNMVVLVVPDANLTVSRKGRTYVIPALLGYPVLQALGRVRLTADHHFLAGPDLVGTRESSPLYMDGSNVLLLATVQSERRMFQLDTGANKTVLYSTYYRDFPEDFAGHRPASTFHGGAVGGAVTSRVEYLDKAEMTLGGRVATLRHVPVQLDAQEDPSSRYEGNIGCDLFSSFDSATFDFAASRFYLGSPTAP